MDQLFFLCCTFFFFFFYSGALYGEYTHIDDIYKNILTDAQQFINDENYVLPSGDQVSVVHYQATDGVTWFRDSIAVAVRSCEHIFL